MTTPVKANQFQIIRIYDAPIQAVWDAWTDLKQVVQWWGPRGFTLTSHSKDLRAGGHWEYTMHGPDGTDYPNLAKYHEVEPLKKLVYDHGGTRDTPPLFHVTALFTDLKGKTRLDMTLTFSTDEVAREMKKFIKKAGGDATWDRLAEHLEKAASGKEKFVINRAFDAPIDVMYDMWTRPEHFSKWLAPTGMSMRFIRADLRPGGTSFYSMSADNGGLTMYGCVEYLQMEKPHLLVYKQQFTDKDEKISRHPMVPVWPETMLTTVLLSEEGAGRARVTVTWEPVGAVKPEELNAFIQMRAGMTQGWTGSFDKLEEELARRT